MSRKETRELRDKSKGELLDEVDQLRKAALGIRVKAPTDEVVNPHKQGAYRKRIARILTILGERERTEKK
jgi:ribosomal protein L29